MRRGKLAYIGGGSLFVPSIINGIGQVMSRADERFEVELALYDINLAKAQRMQAYGEVVEQAWNVPLSARAVGTRAEALAGADVVFVSVWLREEQTQHPLLDPGEERVGEAGVLRFLDSHIGKFTTQYGNVQESSSLLPIRQ